MAPEEMRQPDPSGRRHQPEEGAGEAPGAAGVDDLQARLVVAVEDIGRHPAVGPAVDEGQGIPGVPLEADYGDGVVAEDAAHTGIGLEIPRASWGFHLIQLEGHSRPGGAAERLPQLSQLPRRSGRLPNRPIAGVPCLEQNPLHYLEIPSSLSGSCPDTRQRVNGSRPER